MEALEAFGNCAFDSMVLKKNDFQAKLKASTVASKPLKRKNQENGDAHKVSHSKKPARELTCLGKSVAKNAVRNIPLRGTETSDKVGHNYGDERGNAKLGMSAMNSRTIRVRSHIRPHSSLASSKRMTRVEKARLEAMQSFGDQGLDAVWKSCTQIRSKTLEKREGEGGATEHTPQGADNCVETTLMEDETCGETRNHKETSVEEQMFSKTTNVGTKGLLILEAESSVNSQVAETDSYHKAASAQHCDNKHEHKLTRVEKARMEALQSFSGQKFDEVIKTSTRIMAKYLTPCKNQVTNTEPCEEQDSPSQDLKDQGIEDKQYPKQRIDLFSNIQDVSFMDREALLSTSKRVVETARHLETPSP